MKENFGILIIGYFFNKKIKDNKGTINKENTIAVFLILMIFFSEYLLINIGYFFLLYMCVIISQTIKNGIIINLLNK